MTARNTLSFPIWCLHQSRRRPVGASEQQKRICISLSLPFSASYFASSRQPTRPGSQGKKMISSVQLLSLFYALVAAILVGQVYAAGGGNKPRALGVTTLATRVTDDEISVRQDSMFTGFIPYAGHITNEKVEAPISVHEIDRLDILPKSPVVLKQATREGIVRQKEKKANRDLLRRTRVSSTPYPTCSDAGNNANGIYAGYIGVFPSPAFPVVSA